MGLLDGLFKKQPTPQELEIQRRMAMRRAQQQVNKLTAKSAKLTAEYGKLWEEAKQYLKVGKKAMSEQVLRRCRMLKASIAQYEKRSAGAAALLDKIEFAATNQELVASLNGVMVTVSGAMTDVAKEWAKLGVEVSKLDEMEAVLTDAAEDALSESETAFGEPLDDMETLKADLAGEVELEMQGSVTEREPGQTVNVYVRDRPRDEVTDMVDAGSERLRKLMEEFK